jgi:hypothetical protein
MSKSETNLNDQHSKFKTGPPAGTGVSAIGALDFGFVSDFRNDTGQQASACGGVVVL